MVTALFAVALALLSIGLVLCVLGLVTIRAIEMIWEDLGPLLEHEMLMRRIEVRLMIDDAGYECPEWLNDDDEDDEDENENKKVIRLVPKQDLPGRES
jgi:hypothetical protein